MITSNPVTAIVPAYNEANRLSDVLDILVSYPGFTEIIVIDDGSSDTTGIIAQTYPIRYLKNNINLGKGASMDRAIKAAHTNTIFFCDADITGLTHAIIDEILLPIQKEEVDMFIATTNHFTLLLFPVLMRCVFQLSGERVLTKTLWRKIPPYYKKRFHIEPALNFYSVHRGQGFGYTLFPELKQTKKEKKRGLWIGIYQRMRMIQQITSAVLRLRLTYFALYLQQKTGSPAPRKQYSRS